MNIRNFFISLHLQSINLKEIELVESYYQKLMCYVVLCCVASLPGTLLAKFGMVFWGVRLLTGVPNPMPKQTEPRSPGRALICYGDRSCRLPTASNRSSALTPYGLFLKVRGGSLKESRGPEKGLCMCVVCAYLLVGARG